MAPLKLYYYFRSPPSRACLLLLKYLEVEYEKIDVDLFKGEHLEDWYLEVNPKHQVPTLDDNGFVLTESRAILCYLANSRMPGSSLYPLNPKKRALVDAQLYYDSGTFFPRLTKSFGNIVFGDATEVELKDKTNIYDSLNYLNDVLKEGSFVAGEEVSIADFSFLATVSCLFFMGVNIEDYPDIQRWYEQCKALPGFDDNEEGAQALAAVVNEKVDGDTAF